MNKQLATRKIIDKVTYCANKRNYLKTRLTSAFICKRVEINLLNMVLTGLLLYTW